MKNLNRKRWGKIMVALSLSTALAMTGTAAVPAQTAHAAQATASSSKASRVVATGKSYMHTPYKFAADRSSTKYFDCSSFIYHVYKQNGITLPTSSKKQSKVGRYVPKSQLKPGDLVFFYAPIHHVAIYIGNGKILHTYGKPGVTISDMNNAWWTAHYNTARRVL